jgi:hypothetical protein
MVTDDKGAYDDEENDWDDDGLDEEPDKDEVKEFLEVMSNEQAGPEVLRWAARAAVEEFQYGL